MRTPLRSRLFSKKKNVVRKFANYRLSCNCQIFRRLQEVLKKCFFLWWQIRYIVVIITP